MSRLVPPGEVVYPESDGKPMAETGIHVQAILLLFQSLEAALARASRADAFIAANMFLFWQEGDPKKRVAPDLMVVPGAGRHHRRSFKTWAEGGRVPALIVEVSSDKTVTEDRVRKRRLYRRLGVAEYVLFDPDGMYLPEPLMGYRLDGGRYARLPAAGGRLTSRLGFGLAAEGMMLRLFDGRTGEPIPTPTEAVEAAQRHVDAVQRHADAVQRQAEAAQRQAEAAERQAEAAQRQADAVQHQAAEESARQAAEIARLKALLAERPS